MKQQNKPVEYKSVREISEVVRGLARKRRQGNDEQFYLFEIRTNPAIWGNPNEEACIGIIEGQYHNNTPVAELKAEAVGILRGSSIDEVFNWREMLSEGILEYIGSLAKTAERCSSILEYVDEKTRQEIHTDCLRI